MTSSDLRPQRIAELVAVATVRHWVGEAGTVIDLGHGHGPDFRIDYHDGRTALGEVGWDEDPQIAAMWSAIFRRPNHQVVELPASSGQWGVSLAKGANIKRLYEQLPRLIEGLLASRTTSLDIVGAYPRGALPDQVRELGIRHLAQISTDGPDRAVFFAPSDGGVVPTDLNLIVAWLDTLLADPHYADASGKLLPLAADERHVFFFAGSRTDFGVHELLRSVGPATLPARAPQPPRGITHLWGMGTSGGAGAAMWAAGSWVCVPAGFVGDV